MRSVCSIGRTCLRTTIPKSRPRPLRQWHLQGALRRWGSSGGGCWRPPARRDGLLFATAVGLSPLAFVQLSEKDNSGTEQTAEGRMLQASRDEIKKEVGDDVRGFRRFRDSIIVFVDVYVWEPICTGLRFLHLVVIFVPVLAAVPVIWFGKKDRTRGNERTGTLWWYLFLVKSMERAGPAFIKVSFNPMLGSSADWNSWDNGQLRDLIFFQPKCARSCLNCIRMRQHTLYRRRNES